MHQSKLKHILLTCTLSLLLFSLPAQDQPTETLINPESVAYDHPRGRYLVSCYGLNAVMAIDKGTQQEEVFADNITKPLGNCISDGVLYVSSQENLVGYDLETAVEVFRVTIPCIQHLDGMTTDGEGNIYVIDTGGKIHKVDTETGTSTCVVSSGLAQSVQDCIFDPANNRLLAVAWKNNAPIQAIDLETFEVSTAATTSFGYFDGITIDPDGHVYVASHQAPGKIIRYNNALTEHEIISMGHDEPAGLDYNAHDHVLAVPNFLGNKVDFIDVQLTGLRQTAPDREPLIIYPNPGKGIFSLEINTPPDDNSMLLLRDLNGNSVMQQGIKLANHRHMVDCSHLSRGIYLLSVNTTQQTFSGSLIIR